MAGPAALSVATDGVGVGAGPAAVTLGAGSAEVREGSPAGLTFAAPETVDAPVHEVQSGAGGDERHHDPVSRQGIAAEMHVPAVPGVVGHAHRLGVCGEQDVQVRRPRVLLSQIYHLHPLREEVLQLSQPVFLDIVVVQDQPAGPAVVCGNRHRSRGLGEELKPETNTVRTVRVYVHKTITPGWVHDDHT